MLTYTPNLSPILLLIHLIKSMKRWNCKFFFNVFHNFGDELTYCVDFERRLYNVLIECGNTIKQTLKNINEMFKTHL